MESLKLCTVSVQIWNLILVLVFMYSSSVSVWFRTESSNLSAVLFLLIKNLSAVFVVVDIDKKTYSLILRDSSQTKLHCVAC